MIDFDSDLHSDLFKLMILASNGWEVSRIEAEKLLHDVIGYRYPFQFEDRSLCEMSQSDVDAWIKLSDLVKVDSYKIYNRARLKPLDHYERED